MSRRIIYTYETLEEFNRIVEENESKIFHFLFKETVASIAEYDNVIIDITHLVEYLEFNIQDKLPALVNFEELEETHELIIQSDLAESVLKMFPTFFCEAKSYYSNNESEQEDQVEQKISIIKRKSLYTYSKEELNQIFEYTKSNDFLFLNFTKAEMYESILSKASKHCLIDITSIVYVIKEERRILLLVEQLFETVKHATFVIEKGSAEEALSIFQFNFDKLKSIDEFLPDLKNELNILKIEEEVKITDQSQEQLEEVFNIIKTNLIGHDYFKDELINKLKTFVKFNEFNKKEVFSVFLFGESGIGKTEVARVVQNALYPNGKLLKINFGNYSSKDALNSLIGSPAGYIGYENGELSNKMENNKTGVILFDEIEKATPSIFNFFLELLEDGEFTDSMNREFDLNGYIIIFTSNIRSEEEFLKVIPNEFKSRLNLVCKFEPLTYEQKVKYINFQVQYYIDMYMDEKIKRKIDKNKIEMFAKVNTSKDDLRKIKEEVKGNIMRFLIEPP